MLERRLQPGNGDAGAGEQRRGAAVLLREQRGEQVLRLDEAVVVAERQALGVGERLLELGGQLVETHRGLPRIDYVADGVLAGRFKRRAVARPQCARRATAALRSGSTRRAGRQ